MSTPNHTLRTDRPRRTAWIAAVVLLLAAGLMLPSAAEAQRPERVTSLKLKLQSAGKLQSSQEWKKVVTVSGDTIRPQKGFQMLRLGEIIYITNEDASPPDYQTMKQGVSSNAVKLGKGQCIVIKQICACASTLINNMYGGNADDDCGFNGTASETTCAGAAGCCSYFRSEEPVECPGG